MSRTPRLLSLSVLLAMALGTRQAAAGPSIVEPREPSTPAVGFEMGPWVSVSGPTGAAGDAFSRGISSGVTFTSMQNRNVGVGVDLGYCSWLSPQTGAALDALFGAVSGVSISGTRATLTEIRAVGHVKVVPLPDRGVTPWAQIGFGVSRTNNKIDLPADQLRAAGWTILNQSTGSIAYQPIFTGGGGIDFKIDNRMKIGLDASYQWSVLSQASKPFTAFALGGHILFGRW